MILNLLQKTKSQLSFLDEHTLEVLKESFLSTLVKVFGMGISVILSVALGRLLGADGLGIINLSNRIINILLVVGLLGMRQTIIKEVSIASSKGNNKHVGDVMKTAYWLNGGVTLLLSVILILSAPFFTQTIFNEPRLTYPLIVFLLVLMPQVLSRVFSSALIGCKKIWQSNLLEQTLSVAITTFCLLFIWLMEWSINVKNVAIIYAIGRLSVTFIIGFYWRRLFPNKEEAQLIFAPLLKTSLPMFLITASAVVGTNADAIILGALTSAENVGLYTVAARIALLTSFFLQVTNTVLSPKIASLYDNNQLKELEEMVQRVTKGLTFIGIMMFLVFFFLGEHILNLWGNEFTEAYTILLIVAIGQLVNLGTGAVGVIMLMTGHERIQSKISLAYVALNIILNFGLIYLYGIIGAAIATTTTLIISNVIKVIFVKRLTGINPVFLRIG